VQPQKKTGRVKEKAKNSGRKKTILGKKNGHKKRNWSSLKLGRKKAGGEHQSNHNQLGKNWRVWVGGKINPMRKKRKKNLMGGQAGSNQKFMK